MTEADRHHALLRNHLPEEAVEWVYAYIVGQGIHFHIARHRSTKLGDYRWPQARHPYHEISVNGDLAKPMFLWVFLHEAAHLETRLEGRPVKPHGVEWQAHYARLLREHAELFPEPVRPAIARYAARVPLNHRLGREIEALLRQDGRDGGKPSTRLDSLPAGSWFRLAERETMLLRSLERRRTRWLCIAAADGRRYTVSGQAEVIPQQDPCIQ